MYALSCTLNLWGKIMSSAFRRLATHLGAAGLSLGLAAAPAGAADPAQIALPSDASSDCTITQSEFNSWFAAGAAASNAAATEKPEEVYLAYTVNNLGYTATCG